MGIDGERMEREREAFYERQRARISRTDALAIVGISIFMLIALRDLPIVYLWSGVVLTQVLSGLVVAQVTDSARARATERPGWAIAAERWWVRGASVSWAALPLMISPHVERTDVAAPLAFFVIFGLASDAIYLPQTYPKNLTAVSAAYCLPACVVLGYHGHWLAVASIAGILVHVTSASEAITDLVDDLIHQRVEATSSERAAHLASLTDPLTGLWNRAGIMAQLEELLSGEHESISVCFIDIDDFKTVNDRYGYGTGDTLLQRFAASLKSVAPAQWSVGRFGGDEFIAVGPGSVGPEVASAITAIAITPSQAGSTRPVRASVGTATAQSARSDPATLIDDAGAAVREAKRTTKNTVSQSSPALRQMIGRRSALEHEIESIIDSQQFITVVQPQVELTSTTMIGVELLARWERRGEMVSPTEFIPIVSQLGLDHEFDMMMIERGLELLTSLPPPLSDLQVSVNVSTQRLSSERFLHDLEAALTAHRVNASQLTIEVTESDDLLLDRETLELVTEIVDLGPRLSLDDFGTGYSSITRLVTIPFSEMKLDSSLIQRLKSPESHDLIRTLASFASRNGLDVIAEGIETEWQAGQLRGIGIPYGQGYLYGKPMPIAELVLLGVTEALINETAA